MAVLVSGLASAASFTTAGIIRDAQSVTDGTVVLVFAGFLATAVMLAAVTGRMRSLEVEMELAKHLGNLLKAAGPPPPNTRA